MKSRGFFENTRRACSDEALADKLRAATDRQRAAREVMCEELADVDAFRTLAAHLRDEVLCNLDGHLRRFVQGLEESGVHVHWATDGEEACSIIARVAKDHDVRTIVKSKSMITEEIGLNPALEAEGMEVTETDLGEFIIQLGGQRPSHIVLPAVHLSEAEVAGIFKEKIGYDGPSDAESLTRAARMHLRGKFKAARMGISGVNFALSEEGAWIVCTNEGNGRYVMTLPDLYLGVMGIERIVQNGDSAAVMLKMLGRFATGQRITQYVNRVTGPSRVDGPGEVHLVLLDNGRSRILGTRFWRILRCIRCGACLNACPVFKFIGGQSFPGCYSGPMGSVLLPLQLGFEKAGLLPKACSLCGACNEVCPVKIPLTDLLLELRRDITAAGCTSRMERIGMGLSAWAMRHPMLYRLGQKLMRRGLTLTSREGWVESMPSILGQWTQGKDLPLPAAKSFLTGVRSENRGRQAGE